MFRFRRLGEFPGFVPIRFRAGPSGLKTTDLQMTTRNRVGCIQYDTSAIFGPCGSMIAAINDGFVAQCDSPCLWTLRSFAASCTYQSRTPASHVSILVCWRESCVPLQFPRGTKTRIRSTAGSKRARLSTLPHRARPRHVCRPWPLPPRTRRRLLAPLTSPHLSRVPSRLQPQLRSRLPS